MTTRLIVFVAFLGGLCLGWQQLVPYTHQPLTVWQAGAFLLAALGGSVIWRPGRR